MLAFCAALTEILQSKNELFWFTGSELSNHGFLDILLGVREAGSAETEFTCVSPPHPLVVHLGPIVFRCLTTFRAHRPLC